MEQVAKFCERGFLRGLDVVGGDAVKDHFGSSYSQLPGLPTNNPLFSANFRQSFFCFHMISDMIRSHTMLELIRLIPNRLGYVDWTHFWLQDVASYGENTCFALHRALPSKRSAGHLPQAIASRSCAQIWRTVRLRCVYPSFLWDSFTICVFSDRIRFFASYSCYKL